MSVVRTERAPRLLGRLPGGAVWRAPWPSEASWFRANPYVAGYAADDDRVVLNPCSQLKPRQFASVLINEAVRVYLRRRPRRCPLHTLTAWQRTLYASYGRPIDQVHTVVARLAARDRSAGRPNGAQKRTLAALESQLKLADYRRSRIARTHVLQLVGRRREELDQFNG